MKYIDKVEAWLYRFVDGELRNLHRIYMMVSYVFIRMNVDFKIRSGII